MNINYDDFGVCPYCKTVNVISSKKCRRCNKSSNMRTFKKEIGTSTPLFIFAAFIGIIGMVTFPVGLLIIIFIAIPLAVSKHNNLKQREIEFNREALELFQSTANEQKLECVSSYYKGIEYLRMRNLELAILEFQQSIQKGNENIYVFIGLAICYYSLEQFNSAIQVLKKIVIQDNLPNNTRELLARCYILNKINNNDELEFLVNTRHLYNDIFKNQVTLNVASYICEFYDESYDKYAEILEEAILLNSNNILFKEIIIRMYFNQHSYEKSVFYCSLIDINTMNREVLKVYAKSFQANRAMHEVAINTYNKLLKIDRFDLDIRILLCQSYVKNKRLNDAINVCLDGREISSNVKLRYNLALCYMMNEQIDEAIIELQTLINEIDNETTYVTKPVVFRLLGRCFMKKNMLQIALKQFLLSDRSEEALEQLYELGILFSDKGEQINAKICWDEIYSTDITFRDVANKLA